MYMPFYSNLDLKIFDDNKKIWKNIKPLFSNKQTFQQKNITLVDKNNIISKDNFFIDSVSNLEIEPFVHDFENSLNAGNIEDIIETYKNHPSILKIF